MFISTSCTFTKGMPTNGWDPYIHRAMEYYSAINEALMQSTTLITQNTTLSQKN